MRLPFLCICIVMSLMFGQTVFAAGSGAPINWSDLGLKAFNFAVFLVLLRLFAAKPLAAFFRGKLLAGKTELDAARKREADLKQTVQTLEAQLASTQEELRTLETNIKNDTKQQKASILQQAQEQAEAIRIQTDALVEQSLFKAKSELQSFMAKEAVSAAEKQLLSAEYKLDQAETLRAYTQDLEKAQ